MILRVTNSRPRRSRLVVEQDPAAGVEVIRLAVVDGDEVPVRLRHAVRRAGVERRQLGLRHLADLAEHLARRRLVEARLRAHLAHRLEHPCHPDSGELGGQGRLDPRHRHERHRGEVVDLIGPRCPQRVDQRALVEQVGLVQRDLVAQMLDPVEALGRRAAHHAVDLVALLEQELGQVGAVLAGDPSDQGASPFRHRPGRVHASAGQSARPHPQSRSDELPDDAYSAPRASPAKNSPVSTSEAGVPISKNRSVAAKPKSSPPAANFW